MVESVTCVKGDVSALVRGRFGSNSDRIRAAICYGSWQVQRLYSLYLIDSHEVSIFARARATPGGKAPSRSWRSSRITPAPPAQACYWLEMRSGAARNRVAPKTRPADPRPKINFELASQLVNKCCDIEVYKMASVIVPARPYLFSQVRSNCLPIKRQIHMGQKSVKTSLVELLIDPRLPWDGQHEVIELLRLSRLTWAKLGHRRPALNSDRLFLAACRRAALTADAHPEVRLLPSAGT